MTAALLLPASGQEPARDAPTAGGENQDTLKVSVEEVRIPVSAYDADGRFDPTLEAADLLVREDGVAQQVKGVYRVPASVLLLLDTGGEAAPGEYRRLDVSPRRAGLRVRSRRGYVARAPASMSG